MVADKAPKAKRMRILIYSANFAPEPTGVGKYSGEMAAWLVGEGHEVRVIAAPPYYPAWRIARGYRWPPFRRENYAGADVRRAPIWVPKSPGGIKRMLHLLFLRAQLVSLDSDATPVEAGRDHHRGACVHVRSRGIARRLAHGCEILAAPAGLRSRCGISNGTSQGEAGCSDWLFAWRAGSCAGSIRCRPFRAG